MARSRDEMMKENGGQTLTFLSFNLAEYQARQGSVDIVNTGAAGTPLTTADKALLTVDVWEHAYYIDYRNLRPKFVETFLNNLVNWEFAQANFA